jgi:uncharacterized membrane protein required for colicin V production
MLLDILIGVPMIAFVMLGLRDGVVRKLVAIIVLIGALYLGQIYMHDFGKLLSDNGWLHSEDASMYAYLYIFLGMAIIQGLMYKILTGGYKIGGLADRVGGMVLGFVEGALFLSSLLYIFAMTGFPSRETKRDTRLYTPIVNIAPQILDFTSSIGSDSFDKIKEIGTSKAVELEDKVRDINKSADSTEALIRKKRLEKIDGTREDYRKQNP